MKPSTRVVFWVLLSLVCLAIGLGTFQRFGSHQVAKDVQQADTNHQAAGAARSESVAHDTQAARDEAQKTQDDAQAARSAAAVAQADAQVARVRSALAPRPLPPPGPGLPETPPPAPPVDLTPLVAALEVDNQALKAQHTLDVQRLADRDHLIASLTAARDSWHTSADQSAAEAVQLRAALAAQQGLTKAAELKGFLYGFMFGGATGAGAVVLGGHR